MPEPQAHPHLDRIKRVALYTIGADVGITLLKFSIFYLTNSVAVLSDALESIINIVAACVMLYSILYASQPADSDHPYGHGKIEFMAVGLEGWMILVAAVFIAVQAILRLLHHTAPEHLNIGTWLLGGVGVLSALLANYVWRAGKHYHNAPLLADGKHLWTDVFSTTGVFIGLILIQVTGWIWLDSAVAIVMASLILYASWHLLWESFHGLMDHSDPEDTRIITDVLDDEIAHRHIQGYHKIRHRRNGDFHWVDMHLQVDGDMTVNAAHALASRIEYRIEQQLGQANATAHIEPTRRLPGEDAKASEPNTAPQLPAADASEIPPTKADEEPDGEQ